MRMRKNLHQCKMWQTMDLFQIFVLALYITQAFTKSRTRKHKPRASDEGSIENLLYIKDCQRNEKNEVKPLRYAAPPPPPSSPPPPPQRQPDCPFPKMCCSMTCGNECGSNQPTMSHLNRHTETFSNIQRSNANPDPPETVSVQPPLKRLRKKKMKFRPNDLQVSLPKRRYLSGLTKERIKGVLAQDNDIRKILKDLVRVTMQKVDLQDIINSHSESYGNVYTEPPVQSSMYNEHDYEE